MAAIEAGVRVFRDGPVLTAACVEGGAARLATERCRCAAFKLAVQPVVFVVDLEMSMIDELFPATGSMVVVVLSVLQDLKLLFWMPMLLAEPA